MKRLVTIAMMLTASAAAAETECFAVQNSYQLCQEGSPFKPGNVMSLGLQVDGWDHFQTQGSFTRTIATDPLGDTFNEMHSGYLETVQGQVVDQTSPTLDADGRVNFAVSVRAPDNAKGTPIFVTLLPSPGQVLVIETVFPNVFQLDKLATLTAERRAELENVIQKITAVQ